MAYAMAEGAPSREALLVLIEGVLREILDAVAVGRVPCLLVPNRTSPHHCRYNPRTGRVEMDEAGDGDGVDTQQQQATTFMASTTAASAPTPLTPRTRVVLGTQRYTVLLSCLGHLQDMLLNNASRTVRDVYYNNVNVFRNQQNVSKALADWACYFRVPRTALRCLGSRGNIGGCITLHVDSGAREPAVIDCRAMPSGFQVPDDVLSVTHIDTHDSTFLLVVEKDAVFQGVAQQLLDDGFHLNHPCVLITGKGYPDVSTRALARTISDKLRLPALALVDADPHGMEIALIYKIGSQAMAFDCMELAIPDLAWIGLLPSDLDRFEIPDESYISMTERDHSKLEARPFFDSHPDWLAQLSLMRDDARKAELEAVNAQWTNFLSSVFLPWKLGARETWVADRP